MPKCVSKSNHRKCIIVCGWATHDNLQNTRCKKNQVHSYIQDNTLVSQFAECLYLKVVVRFSKVIANYFISQSDGESESPF